MKALLFGCVAIAICAVVANGQAKKTSPLPDDTSGARRSFNELLSAKDQDVLASIREPHTYVCYRRNKDEFLLVSFGPEDREWTWSPSADNPETQEALEPVFVSDYRHGATDSHGVGLMVVGKWTRRKDSPALPSFYAADRPVDPNDTSRSSNVNIDNDEFRLEEEFQNIAGGVTDYTLTIRRSTGRFTESYDVKARASESGTLTEDDGRCSIFPDGELITEKPLHAK